VLLERPFPSSLGYRCRSPRAHPRALRAPPHIVALATAANALAVALRHLRSWRPVARRAARRRAAASPLHRRRRQSRCRRRRRCCRRCRRRPLCRWRPVCRRRRAPRRAARGRAAADSQFVVLLERERRAHCRQQCLPPLCPLGRECEHLTHAHYLCVHVLPQVTLLRGQRPPAQAPRDRHDAVAQFVQRRC